MITVCQGTPGSGKSAVAVAKAISHLRKGGVVAANFHLVDQWSNVVARQSPLACLKKSWLHKKSMSLYERFFYVDSLNAITSINPRSLSVEIYKDDGKYSEGSGLLILDEAQLVFNSRKWEKNFSWIEFFTQHRKLGWNVLLIAHSIEMIDSQIRPLCEYTSTFRNLQKVRLPVVGLPLSPVPAFLTITRYAGLGAGASSIHSRELLPLPIWAAELYDSLLVFSSEKWAINTPAVFCGDAPRVLNHRGLLDILSDMFADKSDRPKKSSLSNNCLWSKADNHFDDVIELSDVVLSRHDCPEYPITFGLNT